ncbi:MAG TPA: transposase, partial [Candidatus Hypogeohydataceae bacterium YC38]
GYDYSQVGAYFLTICTHNKACVFGDIVNGEMQLNDYGAIVKNEWLKTDKLRRNVAIDEYIIMPNHIHGIIIIMGDGRGTLQRAPTRIP